MSDRFIDWLFDTLISVDVQHQELLGGFGVLLLIPFALFLLSYVRVSFAFIKDRARKGTLDTVTRVLAAELGPRIRSVGSYANRVALKFYLDLGLNLRPHLRGFKLASCRWVRFAGGAKCAARFSFQD
jgi:hypothetical protein